MPGVFTVRKLAADWAVVCRVGYAAKQPSSASVSDFWFRVQRLSWTFVLLPVSPLTTSHTFDQGDILLSHLTPPRIPVTASFRRGILSCIPAHRPWKTVGCTAVPLSHRP